MEAVTVPPHKVPRVMKKIFDEQAFKVWMKQVDNLCVNAFGMGMDDMPDQAYADNFENGVTPKGMIAKIRKSLKDGGY
jgi:hypothetical protein